MTKIALTSTSSELSKKAEKLASKLGLSLVAYDKRQESSVSFLLTITPERLELRENTTKKSNPLFVDFLSSKLNYRAKHSGKKSELIAKAIGIKSKKYPSVLDVTAGFGVDAFILASMGCKVVMLERSPIIYTLLENGLERLNKASGAPSLKISLKFSKSSDYLKKIIADDSKKPDVIYLDPMYPKKSKSALNKKTMRILGEIVGNDSDSSKLLNLALKCAKKRVVVKRPRLAEYLGELKPDLELSSGRSSRYDIYFTEKRTNQ